MLNNDFDVELFGLDSCSKNELKKHPHTFMY